jgi:hypothetical protein
MLLDPARGFCLGVKVTKEARVVTRPGTSRCANGRRV